MLTMGFIRINDKENSNGKLIEQERKLAKYIFPFFSVPKSFEHVLVALDKGNEKVV